MKINLAYYLFFVLFYIQELKSNIGNHHSGMLALLAITRKSEWLCLYFIGILLIPVGEKISLDALEWLTNGMKFIRRA